MCGIIGVVAKPQRDVSHLLLDGLKRLEYRGYDSAGLVIMNGDGVFKRKRTVGKVKALIAAFDADPIGGHIGIAHTRWATHGKPSEANAHPHFSDGIAIVHNGIIENYLMLQRRLLEARYIFQTETDSEVIAHLIHYHVHTGKNLLAAVKETVNEMEGAFAIAAMSLNDPNHLVVARKGAPVVLGLGREMNFVASDPLALLAMTQRIIYLEEGDIAELSAQKIQIYDRHDKVAHREIHQLDIKQDMANKGIYRHYMLKEIMEQPEVIKNTLMGRLGKQHILEQAFGPATGAILDQVKSIQIVACGTSYHAGLVARYWIEELAGVHCQVEVASEIRYRHAVVSPDTLFIVISQSGETADSLAALRQAKQLGYLSTLSICNVPESSLVREADLVFMTHAGTEIGVASTKAFTTQLVALLLLTVALGRRHSLTADKEQFLVEQLHQLPHYVSQVLELDPVIKHLAHSFEHKQHALFLGRGAEYPIALEGALKLKEISYIHAEAYPAGELKHGPLALVDKNMPVVVIVPNDELLEKLKSNLQEVHTRGGELFVFADKAAQLTSDTSMHVVEIPPVPSVMAPIVYTVLLQLLAYHVAVLKGTDVDQPRNLAKSVTVE